MSAPKVHLERPSARWERDFLDAAQRSRALHRGLVTVAATPAEFQGYLRRTRGDHRQSFLVVAAASDELVGAVDLNDIVGTGDVARARIGYFAFAPHAGHGYMRSGLELVVEHAFGSLGLTRLDARIQPNNRRSIGLAERLQFCRERDAHCHLKIGNRWLDHACFVLLRDDWRRSSVRRLRVAERQRGRVDRLAQHE